LYIEKQPTLDKKVRRAASSRACLFNRPIGGGAYWVGRLQARATFGPNGPRIELAHPTFWRKLIFKLNLFLLSNTLLKLWLSASSATRWIDHLTATMRHNRLFIVVVNRRKRRRNGCLGGGMDDGMIGLSSSIILQSAVRWKPGCDALFHEWYGLS
jgi:hypothetical protein